MNKQHHQLSLRIIICLAAILLSNLALGQGTMRFIHPPPENPADKRHTYYWELLEAALLATRDTWGDYSLTAFRAPMNFSRSVIELESGDNGRINVIARATNLDIEARLQPVPIPLDKGILGHRIFLVMPDVQKRLASVKSLDELREFTIGLDPVWSDHAILKDAGFSLVPGNNYEGLFGMLGNRRFDLFARGVIEIAAEWEANRERVPGIMIESTLMLSYPMPRYYFVPKTELGRAMAKRIEEGLRRLAKSGEFERRYSEYKKLVLANINLAGRRVFRIPNTQLSDLAPRSEKIWWDDLSAELAPKR